MEACQYSANDVMQYSNGNIYYTVWIMNKKHRTQQLLDYFSSVSLDSLWFVRCDVEAGWQTLVVIS